MLTGSLQMLKQCYLVGIGQVYSSLETAIDSYYVPVPSDFIVARKNMLNTAVFLLFSHFTSCTSH